MTDRARQLIQQACDAALADFRCYEGGRNVPKDVADLRASLERRLVDRPGQRPGWQRLPALTERLLELRASHPSDYRVFMAGVATIQDPNTMEVLWHMNGVIGLLSDDHDFVLWGEPGEQVLRRQHEAPAWTRGCTPDDVAEALKARLERLYAGPTPVARKSPRP